jgi:hypothetical protein
MSNNTFHRHLEEFEGCTSVATAALSVAWFVSTFIGSPLLGIVRSTAVFVLARYKIICAQTCDMSQTCRIICTETCNSSQAYIILCTQTCDSSRGPC